MKKKGMLLASEVLKVVLAVIGIAFLLYLLFSLYYANINSQKKSQAEDVIKRLKDVVSHLESGSSTTEDITDIIPSGWTVFSFTGNEKKPNLCVGENCLCICDAVSYDNINILGWQVVKDRQLSECDKKGVCLPISGLAKFNDFEIKDPKVGGTSIRVTETSGGVKISEI